MNDSAPAYGLWTLVIINSLVFIIFAFSFAKPQTKPQTKPIAEPPRIKGANAFGNGSAGAFKGIAYVIPPDTRTIPDLAKLTPFASLLTDSFIAQPQQFTAGFPGALMQDEWFAIRYDGAFEVLKDKDQAREAVIRLEHGRPIRFGADDEKGVVLLRPDDEVAAVGDPAASAAGEDQVRASLGGPDQVGPPARDRPARPLQPVPRGERAKRLRAALPGEPGLPAGRALLEEGDVPLRGVGPGAGAAGRFLWNESGEGHIFVANLPPATEGNAYVVWTTAPDMPPRSAGVIQTDASGKGGLHVYPGRSDHGVEAFTVTLEPSGDVSAPTGPTVLASQ